MSASDPRDYCPTCEESADPLREVLTIRWCYRHAPSLTGSADGLMPPSSSDFSTQSYDVEGKENRKRCGLVHRGVAR